MYIIDIDIHILAWRIPWTEEPGRLQSMGLQRARHDWATKHNIPRSRLLIEQQHIPDTVYSPVFLSALIFKHHAEKQILKFCEVQYLNMNACQISFPQKLCGTFVILWNTVFVFHKLYFFSKVYFYRNCSKNLFH